MTHCPANFYFYAVAIGAAVSSIWVLWLLVARAFFRAFNFRPGYLFSILQVVVVLALKRAAMIAQGYCVAMLGVSEPADLVFFRRIWLFVWILAMASSIQIFLDIRRMATSTAGEAPPPSRRRPRTKPPLAGVR